MTDRPRRKSDAARRANQVIRGRTMLIMLLLGVASFTVLFWKLYDLQINRHDELKAEAVGQQTDSMVISASRGTIYDKNGEIMAISYSTETVLLDPGGVQDFVESQEQKIQDAAEELPRRERLTRRRRCWTRRISPGASAAFWMWRRRPSWSTWRTPPTDTGRSKRR